MSIPSIPSIASAPSITGGGDATARFIQRVKNISPGNIQMLYVPDPRDATTNTLAPDGRVHTRSATAQGRFTRQGDGLLVAFDGTSEYVTTPDTADLSLTTGAADRAGSLLFFGRVTSAAPPGTLRGFITKLDTTSFAKREFDFGVNENGKLLMQMAAGTGTTVTMQTDDVVDYLAPHLYAMSYDGRGGANAQAGVTLYIDAVVPAQTGANGGGGYTFMPNTVTPLYIGCFLPGGVPGGYHAGNAGVAAKYGVELSAAQQREFAVACQEYYDLALVA